MNKNWDWSWFDSKWFDPELITQEFEYLQPGWFYLLPVPLLLYIAQLVFRTIRRNRLEVAYKEQKHGFEWHAILALIPSLLRIIAIMLIIFALARPQKVNEKVDKWSEGIDIMLTLDLSHSMSYMDFKPNRLQKVKETASDFIRGRFQDRIGVVAFAGESYIRAPLTTDTTFLLEQVNTMDFDDIDEQGTAIGNALGLAVSRMKDAESDTKVIILLGDGDNNAGSLSPEAAAKLAKKHDIKIYSILVGKKGRILAGYQTYQHPFSGKKIEKPRYMENTVNEEELRRVAEIGGGRFFRAEDSEALKSVFSTIDQYEKSEIKIERYKSTKEYYNIYLYWALLFFLLWLLTKSTFMTSALID